MKRKFKHYATDEIIEADIINGLMEFNNIRYELGEFQNGVKVKGTSWVLVKNE